MTEIDKLKRQVVANAEESASASKEMRGNRKQSGNGHTNVQDQAATLPAPGMETDKLQRPAGITTQANLTKEYAVRSASGDEEAFSDF